VDVAPSSRDAWTTSKYVAVVVVVMVVELVWAKTEPLYPYHNYIFK